MTSQQDFVIQACLERSLAPTWHCKGDGMANNKEQRSWSEGTHLNQSVLLLEKKPNASMGGRPVRAISITTNKGPTRV